MDRIEHGDCLEVIPRLVAEGVVVDSIVTDPPYLLGFMNSHWDEPSDRFHHQWTQACFEILKPGGYLLCFGGTRTHHRLWCAIEDAGFKIQDTLGWIYGSGFPKHKTQLKPAWEIIARAQKPVDLSSEIAQIGSDLNKLWSRLWQNFPAKNAAEFITLCSPELEGAVDIDIAQKSAGDRKSLVGLSAQMGTSQFLLAMITSLSTVSSWSAILSAVWRQMSTSTISMKSSTIIDWKTLKSCLLAITPSTIVQAHAHGHLSSADVGTAENCFNDIVHRLNSILARSVHEHATLPEHTRHRGEAGVEIEPICMAYKPSGKRKLQIDDCRTPTNEVLTGGARKLWSHYRDGKEPERALRIDDCRIPTDELQSGYHHRGPDNVFEGGLEGSFYYDGSKGRYPANVLHDGSDEVLAAFAEFGVRRSAHGGGNRRTDGTSPFGVRKAGVSSAVFYDDGTASRFFFSAKATKEERGQSKHPTVKPLALLSWLVRLVTPREGTVLDPFAGSGTMGHAAFKEGCYTILIEREQHYVDTIRQRLEWQQPAKPNRRPRPRGAKWMTKI